MVIKNIEGRYIISDFDITKIKKYDTGEVVPFKDHGTFSGRNLYTLDSKSFETLSIFGPREDMYVTILSGVSLLNSKINFHTESMEYKLSMLGELVKEIEAPRRDVLSAAYCIPFRKKIKKYPKFMFGVGVGEDGIEHHHCINFQDGLLRMMLFTQKWASDDHFINELEKLEFIDAITYDRKIKIKNYKRIVFDGTEVTREEFLGIFNDFISFIEDELKEMDFKFFTTEFTEGMKWVNLLS